MSFIRTRALALAVSVAAVTGCSHATSDTPPAQVAPPPTATNAPNTNKPAQVSLKWGTGWSFRVRPAFSGSSLSVGDGTVTIEDWSGGPNAVAYDFPAFTSNAAPPEVIARSEGFLRHEPAKGKITVSGELTHAPVFSPTVFWPGGDAAGPGPLLWIPPEVTAALRSNGEAEMKIAPLPNGLRVKTVAASGGETVTLKVTNKGEVALAVDGKTTRFAAYKLTDDQGSTYTMLDSPDNPLVVRFRFGPSPIVDGKKLVMGASCGYDVVSLSSPPKK